MPTLRCILKYVPAVVLGLLVVAWVASAFAIVGTVLPSTNGGRGYGILCGRGTIAIFYSETYPPNRLHTEIVRNPSIIGAFRLRSQHRPLWVAPSLDIQFPLAWIATALLPLAIGPFLSFRFRLWHYLAFTALVAVELAYYLRWQE
jgi:hypothetical protein